MVRARFRFSVVAKQTPRKSVEVRFATRPAARRFARCARSGGLETNLFDLERRERKKKRRR